MRHIYQRGGSVAKSKFDYSKLKPVSDNAQSGFNESLLKPLEEEQTQEMPEEESWYSKLPRNILAGLGQMQRNAFNTPHALAEFAEGQIKNIGRPFMSPEQQKMLDVIPFNPLSKNIPHQSEKDFAKFFGQQGEPTLIDTLIQKGVEHAPDIAGITSLLRKLPITKGPGVRALNKVKKQVGERGIENLNLPPHILKDIVENGFLRNTHANRNLLKKAKKGGYNELFDLQSDLARMQRAYGRNIFSAAERQLGRDIGITRDELLNHMRQELGRQGHNDLGELMRHGQNRYRQYMQFKPYRNAAIGLGLTQIVPGYNYLKKLIP